MTIQELIDKLNKTIESGIKLDTKIGILDNECYMFNEPNVRLSIAYESEDGKLFNCYSLERMEKVIISL